ncbi:hypothetical protein WAA20_17745 [Butyrivibrio fibrisolvens]|uniref:hypothetical protein n=1 Tax=Butyrivibrio fibrisolvens TaxID=831 RepID=UPI0030CB7C4E
MTKSRTILPVSGKKIHKTQTVPAGIGLLYTENTRVNIPLLEKKISSSNNACKADAKPNQDMI